MKKLIIHFVAITSILFSTTLLVNPLAAQTSTGGNKPIPDVVMKIADKSCMHCHAEPGNKRALAHVNLTNWDKYSPKKQASKSKAMCNMVTKGMMPPKKFRETHPDGVPGKDEVKTICDWAQSLKLPKK